MATTTACARVLQPLPALPGGLVSSSPTIRGNGLAALPVSRLDSTRDAGQLLCADVRGRRRDGQPAARGFHSRRCRSLALCRGSCSRASASRNPQPRLSHLRGQVRKYIDLFMDVSPPTGAGRALHRHPEHLRWRRQLESSAQSSLEGDYPRAVLPHRASTPRAAHLAQPVRDRSSLCQSEVARTWFCFCRPPGTWSSDYRGASRPRPRKPTPATRAVEDELRSVTASRSAAALLGTTPPLVYVFPNPDLQHDDASSARSRLSVSTRLMSYLLRQLLLFKGAPPGSTSAGSAEH